MLEFPSAQAPENIPLTLEQRHAKVIADGEFFEEFKDEMRELFEALGLEPKWSDDPMDMLPMIKRQWIEVDLGHGATTARYTDEQIEAAYSVIERMGLTESHTPPAGHYDGIIVLGGAADNMNARVAELENMLSRGITADEICVFAGQRMLNMQRDGSPELLLHGQKRFDWQYDISDEQWLREALVENSHLADETALAVASLAGHLGSINRIRPVIKLHDANKLKAGELPPDLPGHLEGFPKSHVDQYWVELAPSDEHLVGPVPVKVLHDRPENRGDRVARPTTRSTMIAGLNRFFPYNGPTENKRRIVIISGSPHALRMHEECQRILDDLGRSDIEMVTASAPPVRVSLDDFMTLGLGEVGRLFNRSPSVKVREEAAAKISRDEMLA